MRVVITRPAGDAPTWVDAVQAAGHTAQALPLIDVGPASDAQAVMQAWSQWSEFQAVMFVSAQAVRYFFDRQSAATRVNAAQAHSASWPHSPRCWATGPGTHKALLQAGVPEACIDSPLVGDQQFDSEALWQRVAHQVQPQQHVLIVRGADAQQAVQTNGSGRDWLAQQLQAAGAQVHFVVAYERRLPTWTAAQLAVAQQAARDGSVWLLSSSQAVAHLQQLLPQQSWANARCVATHPRIAQAAKALSFGEVLVSRPLLADLLASLESMA